MDVTNGDFNGVMFTLSIMALLVRTSESLLLLLVLLLRSAMDDGVITTGSE